MKIILVFLLTVFAVGLSVADERLGPDVTDYYLEPVIGGYVQGGTGTPGVAVVASVWFVKYKVDLGIEAVISDNAGAFLSARYPVNNEINFGVGIGQIGYNVDTNYGDYWAKPVAGMLFADYQTGYGKIILRGVFSESSRSYSGGAQTCVHTNAPPDNHLDSCSGGQTVATDNRRQVIMLGFQRGL